MPVVKEDEGLKVLSTDPSAVEIYDVMAVINFVKVTGVDRRNNLLHLKDVDSGMSFDAQGDKLIAGMLSADRYSEEKKITMTEASELLDTLFNRPFTAYFKKQDKTMRLMRCRLVSKSTLGRSNVEDLDIVGTFKERVRQVDHRTLEFLIVGGVKYTVK